MSAATPRPWRIAYRPDGSQFIEGQPFEISSVGRAYVKEDASLIVRAVNAHDALVEACEAAHTAIGHLVSMDAPDDAPTFGELLTQLRAALALAKGGG